jgi:DNA-binding MarR family transcriptional regulator
VFATTGLALTDIRMNNLDREEALTLEILEAIDEQSDLTQRGLAARTGVALGLANSYLKRCVRKGLVKIQQVPANRYLYYLTPHGFAEKSRLTAEYLRVSFSYYRKASDACTAALTECRKISKGKIGIAGVSELAEIASLRALEVGITVGAVFDTNHTSDKFLNHRVVRVPTDAKGVRVWLLTELDEPQSVYQQLLASVSDQAIVVPTMLSVQRVETTE